VKTAEAGAVASKKSLARRADAALMLLTLVWGSTFVVVKGALQDASAMCFLALRFATAALCLVLLFLHSFRYMTKRELWCGLRGGLLVGVLLWLGFGLQTWGLERTTASNSGFLTGLYIVLVPLFSAAAYRRWPRPAELVGITVAGVGLVFLTAPSVRSHWTFNLGDILTIGCAVAFALHLLTLGYFSQRERFEVVATGQVICAGLFSAVALIFEPPRITWNAPVVFAILLTGVLATALAFTLQTWAQQYTTATRTALILSLESVVSYATAVLFANEKVTLRSLFGGGLILTGILVVELRRVPE
jgi:drug/metabolite transporter (DMT)-like permease